MNRFSKKRLKNGLDYYNPEERIFPKIKRKVGRNLCLDERDVLLILKWKLGRIRNDNAKTLLHLDKINQAIKEAKMDGHEIRAVESLQKIPGIGLAMATAILTVCYPHKFTIIDARVLEMLRLRPYDTAEWKAKTYWEEFLPKVKTYKRRWRSSLRKADQALWGLSVRKRVAAIIRKARTMTADGARSSER